MRAAAAWVGPAAVLLAATGCGADQRADPVDRSRQAAQECTHHIDELITERVVPGSDRDYATEMCLRQH